MSGRSYSSIDNERVQVGDKSEHANNSMRHNYRELSGNEKDAMMALKDQGLAFSNLLHAIGGTDQAGDRFGSADLTLAQRHIEDAVMRGIRHITK